MKWLLLLSAVCIKAFNPLLSLESTVKVQNLILKCLTLMMAVPKVG